MIVEFKEVEEPFLHHPYDAEDREGKYSLDQADPDDYYNTEYTHLSIWQRFKWLEVKSKVVSIENRLEKLQTRRIAKQTADLTMYVGGTVFCNMVLTNRPAVISITYVVL